MSLKDNAQKGRLGEQAAADYLKKAGYKIIERNMHYSKNAEIDIIAEDKGELVFIEVKTRTSLNFGHPFEAVNKLKLQKIKMAAYAYLNSSEKKYKSFRIDAIAVIGLKNPKIEHVKNIGMY